MGEASTEKERRRAQGMGDTPEELGLGCRVEPVVSITCGDDLGAWDHQEPRPKVVGDPSSKTMYSSQSEAIEILGESRYAITIGPPGTGKTTIGKTLIRRHLVCNPTWRAWIVIPQTNIKSGWITDGVFDANGNYLPWHMANVCCDTSNTTEKIRRFLNFTISSDMLPDYRAMISTYAAATLFWANMNNEKKKLLEHIFFWVDEAHHAACDDEITNRLGSMLHNMMARDNRIGMSTASFFRSDMLSIIPEEKRDLFDFHSYGYDQYFSSMRNIKKINIKLAYYDTDFCNTVVALLKNDPKKTIVYLPHPQTKFSTKDKCQESEKILRALGATDLDSPVVSFPGGKAINFVNGKQMVTKKKYIGQSDKNALINRDANRLDVILTIGMFKEGFDWHYVRRVIVVGPRNSMVEMVQIIGRLLRDIEGKEEVELVVVLPEASMLANHGQQDNLNCHLTAIFMCMMLQEIYVPTTIASKDAGSGNGHDGQDFLVLLDKYGISYGTAMARAAGLILRLNETGLKGPLLYEAFLTEMQKELLKMGLASGRRYASVKLWAIYARLLYRDQSMPIKSISEEWLSQVDVVDGIKTMAAVLSGRDGHDIFGILKDKLCADRQLSLEETMRVVHEAGITTEKEYKRFAASNPLLGLPMNPRLLPRFPGWTTFIGKGAAGMEVIRNYLRDNKIAGWAEANNMARSIMGIKTSVRKGAKNESWTEKLGGMSQEE